MKHKEGIGFRKKSKIKFSKKKKLKKIHLNFSLCTREYLPLEMLMFVMRTVGFAVVCVLQEIV